MPHAKTKWWLIGLPLGLLLLLGVAILAADLFDRRLIADPLVAAVERRTGRTLRLDQFDLRWGWPLALYAENVHLANAEWAGDGPMLKAGAARLTVNPIRLLEGPPYARLYLREPHARVERGPDGRWNWQMGAGESGGGGGGTLPVTLEAQGGGIVYRAATLAEPLRIDLQRLAVLAPDSAGPEWQINVTLRATRNGQPLVLDAGLSPGPTWRIDGGLRAGNSAVTADISIDTTGEMLMLRGRIEGDRIAPRQLAELVPPRPLEREPTRPLPRLDGFEADLGFELAELQLPSFALQDISARLQVVDGRLSLDEVQASLGDARMAASAQLDTLAPAPALQLAFQLRRQPLAAFPDPVPASSRSGEVAADITARIEMPDRRMPLAPGAVLSRLAIPQGRFVYARGTAGEGTGEVIAGLEVLPAGGTPQISLTVAGIEAPPFDATLTAPPLAALAGDDPYRARLMISTPEVTATLQASLREIMQGPGLEVRVTASGDALPAIPALDFSPPDVPPFEVSAMLHHEAARWRVSDLSLTYGDSRLAGSGTYVGGGDRPKLSVDASAGLLDLTVFSGSREGETSEQPEAADAAPWISEGLAGTLRDFDADVALDARRVRIPGDRVLNDVQLSATLDQGTLHLDEMHFGIAGGSVRGSLRARAAQTPVDGQARLVFKEIALGRLDETFTALEEYLGRLSGELQFEFAERAPGRARQDILLPTLGRLTLHDSRLAFDDTAAGTDLSLTLATQGLDAPGEAQSLIIQGKGRYHGEPMQLDFRGDPLLALRDRREPYGLDLDLDFAGTRIQLDGELERAWAPQTARFDFSARGDNPARLEALLGELFLGSFPPYRVNGTLVYDGGQFVIQALDGVVGDSDIHGELRYSGIAGSPAVSADLSSRRLDLDDIAGVIGGSPAAGPGEMVSPEQRKSARQRRGQVFPGNAFDITSLKNVQADIEYRADEVQVSGIPIEDLRINFQLQDGRLLARPVRFGVGEGSVSLRLDMQAGGNAVAGLIDIEARGVDLATALEEVDLAANSFGVIGGQGKLWVSGDSVASMMASADGGLMLLMTGGALDSLLVEAAGTDAGEALLAASGLADPVSIDCAYASLHSRSGMVDVDRFVVDTADTTFFLDGSIDLGREKIDLTLYPEAKDVGLPAADTPLDITGSLANPDLELLNTGLITQAAGSLALTALASPVAALLPFIELGVQAEPAICRGWVEQLREIRTDDS